MIAEKFYRSFKGGGTVRYIAIIILVITAISMASNFGCGIFVGDYQGVSVKFSWALHGKDSCLTGYYESRMMGMYNAKDYWHAVWLGGFGFRCLTTWNFWLGCQINAGLDYQIKKRDPSLGLGAEGVWQYGAVVVKVGYYKIVKLPDTTKQDGYYISLGFQWR